MAAGGIMHEKQRMKVYETVAHLPETLLKGYILDGDPQSPQELQDLMTWQSKPQYVFILDPTDREILHRVANAKANPNSGAVQYPTRVRNL